MNQSLTPRILHHQVAAGHERSRAHRIGLRMLSVLALLGGTVAVTGFVDGVPAAAASTACEGVLVVVDFTDLGGEVEVRCAEGDQSSGRDALTAATFELTDSQPGFLCAINAMPDPCPETFDGSFWAYWHSTPDGEWTNYQVGADASTPALGDIEGWRYNDGATPPSIAPSLATSMLSPAPEATGAPNAAVPDAAETSTSDEVSTAAQSARQTAVTLWTIVGFGGLLFAVIFAFVAHRRRSDSGAKSTKASS